MNPFLIVAIVLSGALILYLIFLGIAFAGSSQNLKAQGIEKQEGD